MGYLQAIFLGIVQGLTEFLPVSSSGHLVILQGLWELEPESEAMILFDLAVHVGTMGAILVFYRRSLRKYVPHLLGSLGGIRQPGELYRRSASVRFTILGGAATLATGAVYVLFGDAIKRGFEDSVIVAICWMITAALLLITDFRRHTRRSLREFGLTAALLVGAAQGAALLPGISRSGATICVAVFWGLHRRWAGEFSFFIGGAAITGATLIEGIKFFSRPHEALAWGPMVIGMLVSGAVGWAALGVLIRALRRAKLKYFAVYLLVIAAATLVITGLLQNGG
ncbi:MAG: hypothetical protein AMJ79_06410 [Phycisphaerae bacterium SM23_30]|nr:MAG: hypothetical protein AMJ79_06410 [Phycisphaerae bacterium SM23_30]